MLHYCQGFLFKPNTFMIKMTVKSVTFPNRFYIAQKTSMSMTTVAEHQLSPQALSLIPLFYIGWSDSVLSPSEMALIHRKIEDLTFLDAREKAYLIRYTNPQNPPSPEVFRSWLDSLRAAAGQLPPDQKNSLAQLGIDIARASRGAELKPLDEPALLKALSELEQELGVDTEEDLQAMLKQLEAPQLSFQPKLASFDAKAMQAILDGQRAATINAVRHLLKDPFFQTGILRDKTAHRASILDMTTELAKQGYGALAYPPAYGGKGDMGEYIAIFQTLATHDLSLTVKFGVQFGLFGGAVYHLGTDKHHRKYLEPTGAAALLGCFAMTETGHGSNVKDLETTATYDHATRSIVVHTPHYGAGKEYIGNALHGSMAAVFAQLVVDGVSHGIHCVLVPYRDPAGDLLPGIEVKDCGYKLGLNGVDNGRLWFNQVRVPVDNLLNRYGDIDAQGQYNSPIENPNKRFFTMLGALVGGRICVGLGGLSATKTALTIAIRYALKRRQFAPKDGEPETLLMDYPTHQHRLIPLLVKTYVYHFALNRLGETYAKAQPDDMREIETQAAGLKAMATWHATHSIQECREACGGKGYLAENHFADLKADSDIFTTFEGDNTVLLQLVAKGLLTEFKQSFHDDGFLAVMRYLGGRIGQTLTTYNAYFTGNTDMEHLMSAEFHADALRYRQERILIALSDRMRKYLGKRLGPYEAFLKCQVHMVNLAKAYVENLAYTELTTALKTMNASPEKAMLEKIATYFALHTISEDKGWFLESAYMDGNKSKAIRRALGKLTQELRPEVEELVAAFGISDASLDAEILR
jgi:acyl-CoA oxidase